VKYAVALTLALIAAPVSATDNPMKFVVLGGLDKVTARVQNVAGPVGQPMKFGSLEIVARSCTTHPPEEPPENAAFLEVFEQQPGKQRMKLFSGWMFSSTPALSALDHPVYDIWVLRCENSASSSSR
jgi:hypothetical protein